MALARTTSSHSVFVGNIPYDANEDELKEIFNRAGNVLSVRLVVDRDTRQPRGYAFIDFGDSNSVNAAIEKLTNYEYNGRKLRVDGAERELTAARPEISRGPPTRGGPVASSDPPPLPPKVTTVQDRMAMLREQAALEQAKTTAQETAARTEVARLMETMTPLQLLHIIGEMQRLAVIAPDVAKALVSENVQLGLALAHAEFLVGLLEEPGLPTDAEVKERAKSVREKLWYGASPPTVPHRASYGSVPVAMPAVMSVPPPPPGVGPGMRFMPGAPVAYGPMLATRAAPLVAPYPQAPATVPPRAAVPPPALNLNASQTEEERKKFLERLAQLSPQQIDELPPDQKMQLLQFLQTLPPTK